MSIKVRQVIVDGYEQFIATLRLASGLVIEIASHSEEAAIQEVEEEARMLSSSNYNPNAGVNFDEDEQDYYC